MKKYLHNFSGTPYGYKPTECLKGRDPNASPTVKNLYFSSAWEFIGSTCNMDVLDVLDVLKKY